MTVWNEDFNAGYEAGYKDGESSGYADATIKYEDIVADLDEEISALKQELREAYSDAHYWRETAQDAQYYRDDY